VKKFQIQILAIITVMFVGFAMFSIANATTPEENKIAGISFLDTNAKKTNVVTTASGLQYEILTKGAGAKHPSATDNVTVHYKGTTIDGKEFDSSYSHGAPITFPLNGVIAGWTEGVQLMTEGAKYRFFIPANLAYGERGAGPIAPNSTLIFDVELIKIN
jgi:FKBP-type peptidyl-prolyl cis-trans isomerase